VAIVGVGVDAIEIDRVQRALERTPSLMDRLFTAREQQHCAAAAGRRRTARFAARFAAKEAVAKALGTGVVGFSFRDVEIVAAGNGAPSVVLGTAAQAVADGVGVTALHVSLSVTRDTAVATAIAES
jgi:holo-[acyl-carrier protein] synthase